MKRVAMGFAIGVGLGFGIPLGNFIFVVFMGGLFG